MCAACEWLFRFCWVTVLVFTNGNSNENVDYGGRLCCTTILQQVEGFWGRTPRLGFVRKRNRHWSGCLSFGIMTINVGFGKRWSLRTSSCREPHDFCKGAMVVVFFLFGSKFYEAGVVFVITCLLLLCFHPKPSFLMDEDYVLWVVKLHI